MTRCALIFALLLAIAPALPACTAIGAADRDLPTLDARTPEDRALFSTIGDALSEHVEDCGKGLDFTFRAVGNRVSEDWERTIRAFR